MLVTGSGDKTLRLWDMSGKELRVLHGHSADVTCVAFMPNGCQVVSGSNDKTLRVWDIASGDTLRIFTGLVDVVTSVAVFPDGLKIASSSGKIISIWSLRGGDTNTGKGKNDSISLPNVVVDSMAFSANGRMVIVSPSLCILDTTTLEEKAALDSDGVYYRGVALSTSGNRVAAVTGGQYEPGVIKVWDLKDNDVTTNQLILQGHTDLIHTVSFSHDEHKLVSASDDGTARVWDTADGNQIHVLHSGGVNRAAFSHDGSQIVTTLDFETVHVWDGFSGMQLHEFDANVNSVTFSSDDYYIIASGHTTINIYNAKTFRLEHTHKSYQCWTTMNDGSSYALSNDMQWICYSPQFNAQPHRLLWIPSQYRPDRYFDSSGPLFTSASRGIQVCLPRKDGLVTLIIPHNT